MRGISQAIFTCTENVQKYHSCAKYPDYWSHESKCQQSLQCTFMAQTIPSSQSEDWMNGSHLHDTGVRQMGHAGRGGARRGEEEWMWKRERETNTGLMWIQGRVWRGWGSKGTRGSFFKTSRCVKRVRRKRRWVTTRGQRAHSPHSWAAMVSEGSSNITYFKMRMSVWVQNQLNAQMYYQLNQWKNTHLPSMPAK